MMTKAVWANGLAVAVAVGCTGCASMFTGTKQHIPISSNPPGASVTINGEPKGRTPISVDLTRTQYHSINLELDGYEPYCIQSTKGLNWVIFWNFFSPFYVGFIVDFADGAYAQIEPKEVSATLTRKAIATDTPIQNHSSQAPNASAAPDTAEQLKKLKEMKVAGLITEDEYQQKRKTVLDRF